MDLDQIDKKTYRHKPLKTSINDDTLQIEIDPLSEEKIPLQELEENSKLEELIQKQKIK